MDRHTGGHVSNDDKNRDTGGVTFRFFLLLLWVLIAKEL